MFFQYFSPAEDVARYAGSYYELNLPGEARDIMRAEIANIRFIISGAVMSDQSGAETWYKSGTAILCGPTFRWSQIAFEPGTVVFGIAVTPEGWAQMIGAPADQLADETIPLQEGLPSSVHPLINQVFMQQSGKDRARAVDAFIRTLGTPCKSINESFLEAATAWLVDPEPNELEDFLSTAGLSHRQIDRLCRRYFGASPKKLHRKFRALQAANRLCWEELVSWRDVAATAYYDQAHFSREFKQFNGRTPKEFINGPHLLVRMTLEQRRSIKHQNPFSLIG